MQPHRLNVLGDFYVVADCCTACGVPRTEAPNLFGMTTEPHDHCYVKRQPQSEDELNQMLSAICCAELACIRYRGNNAAIITRLSAMGEMAVCDTTPPPGTELGLRTHVTFALRGAADLRGLAASFQAFVKSQDGPYSRIAFPWRLPIATTVAYQQNGGPRRNVVFDWHARRVHLWHDGRDDPSVSRYIARWLATLDGVMQIRWYTDDGWRTTGVWHSTHE